LRNIHIEIHNHGQLRTPIRETRACRTGRPEITLSLSPGMFEQHLLPVFSQAILNLDFFIPDYLESKIPDRLNRSNIIVIDPITQLTRSLASKQLRDVTFLINQKT
jgi:hypothetical protein